MIFALVVDSSLLATNIPIKYANSSNSGSGLYISPVPNFNHSSLTLYFSQMSLIDLSATKLKKVSFASCTDRMLAMAEDDSCPLQMDAYECLSNMLNDVKVLAIAIQRLEQKQGHEKVILGAMLRYFTAAPPPRLIPTRKIVVRKVSPFMKSEDVNIRQCAVRILAEFKKKIPKEFHSLFKKLTPAQQRMVEYSAAQ